MTESSSGMVESLVMTRARWDRYRLQVLIRRVAEYEANHGGRGFVRALLLFVQSAQQRNAVHPLLDNEISSSQAQLIHGGS